MFINTCQHHFPSKFIEINKTEVYIAKPITLCNQHKITKNKMQNKEKKSC